MSPHSTKGTSDSILTRTRAIPLSYSHQDPEASSRALCFTLRPEWEEDEGEVEFVPLKDGITNTLIKAIKKRSGFSEEQIDREAVLIRVYGEDTELLINRDREITSHTILAQRGLAPPLLARFQNGLIYEFIRGHVCSATDLTQEPIWRAVACRLAQWHALLPISQSEDTTTIKAGEEIPLSSSTPTSPIEKQALDDITPGKPPPSIWTVMQQWIFNLPTKTPEELERRKSLQNELTRSASDLRDTPGLGEGLVLGHCDLLSGNVIVQPCDPDTKAKVNRETVNFIDYEYATPAPVAFDLANHFSEWGGFECQYENLPTRETRRTFIQEYIRSYVKYAKLNDQHSDEFYVRRLTDEVDRFRGIPGLYWGIWALIQASISHIDFDYAAYAETRLAEYFAWRAEQDGSRKREGREMPLREKRWAQDGAFKLIETQLNFVLERADHKR